MIYEGLSNDHPFYEHFDFWSLLESWIHKFFCVCFLLNHSCFLNCIFFNDDDALIWNKYLPFRSRWRQNKIILVPVFQKNASQIWPWILDAKHTIEFHLGRKKPGKKPESRSSDFWTFLCFYPKWQRFFLGLRQWQAIKWQMDSIISAISTILGSIIFGDGSFFWTCKKLGSSRPPHVNNFRIHHLWRRKFFLNM